MMCERPPRSLRSCERIGDKGSDPKVCCWICDIPPEGLTPCPQFVHSFFARVSPSRVSPAGLSAGPITRRKKENRKQRNLRSFFLERGRLNACNPLFSPVRGRAAEGGRGS